MTAARHISIGPLALSALLIGAVFGTAGCESGSSDGAGRQIEQEQVAVEPMVIEETVRPVPPHRLAVVANTAWPDNAAVVTVLTECFVRRGVAVVDPAQRNDADVVVVAYAAARPDGTWGGIPREQVMLRYALLNVPARTRIEEGVEAMAFAAPSVAAARRGALRRNADRIAEQVVATLLQLPVPQPPPPPPADVEPPTVLSIAPLPFHNATGRPALDGWCETLTAIAAQQIIASGRYRVVERTRFADVLAEEDMANLFGAQPAQIVEVSRRIGADLLLLGELSVRPDGQLALTARFIQDREVRQVIVAVAPPARPDDLEVRFRRQLPQPEADWIPPELRRLRQLPNVWPE